MATYKVVRYYQKEGKRAKVQKTGLTKEQAQVYCQNPETSSKTATSASAKEHTRRHGPWFDGFTVESGE